MNREDKLKSVILDYIRVFELNEGDLLEKSFDEILIFYILSLGINKTIFDDFICCYGLNCLEIPFTTEDVYDVMGENDLFNPIRLIDAVTDYINNYKRVNVSELEFLKGQVESDELNLRDSSVPLRQSEAYSDLTYSKLRYGMKNYYFDLCDSTLSLSAAVYNRLKSIDFGRSN